MRMTPWLGDTLSPLYLAVLELQKISPCSHAGCEWVVEGLSLHYTGKTLCLWQFCMYLKAFICEVERSRVSLCTSPAFAYSCYYLALEGHANCFITRRVMKQGTRTLFNCGFLKENKLFLFLHWGQLPVNQACLSVCGHVSSSLV